MPSTSNNTSPATPATAHPDVPPFPSPATFSILPDIWLLLARLNILHQQLPPQTPAQTNGHHQQPPSSASSQQQQGHPPSQTLPSTTASQQSQTLPPPPPPPAGNASAPAPAPAPAPAFPGAPLLDLKDLPAQIYPLKQRLAKARAAVTALPDVDRTVAEQEAEICRLERVVSGLKGRLSLLGEIAAKVGGEDVRDVEMKDEDKEENVGEGEVQQLEEEKKGEEEG
ncbi:hypothetical protein CLAIMM_06452 [Cladophialophora immunda]|nr:hypothetical protein CLAIMM_06452 [Cladophialophora immunda]